MNVCIVKNILYARKFLIDSSFVIIVWVKLLASSVLQAYHKINILYNV